MKIKIEKRLFNSGLKTDSFIILYCDNNNKV